MPFLVQLICILAILGFCFWLFDRFVPVASPFKQIIYGVVALGCIWWVLETTGIVHTHAFVWHH